jgi:hypothetical protein
VSATAPARTRGLAGAAVIVCVALGVAAVVGRAKVVALAPGTAGLYAAIGLPASAPALDFHGVAAEMVGTGSEAALVIEGEIANMSGDEAALPAIELSVRNAEGRPFYTWTSEPPRRTLPANETTRFRARLSAPPAEGTQVLVRFASARDGLAAGRTP